MPELTPEDELAEIQETNARFYRAIEVRDLRFTLSDLQIQVEGNLAWVTGTENILSQSQGNISVTAVLATNVFDRRGTRWRMVLHHASHILTGEPESEGYRRRSRRYGPRSSATR